MSVMLVIVLHPRTAFDVRIGLPVPKIGLIFRHGDKRPGGLDL